MPGAKATSLGRGGRGGVPPKAFASELEAGSR